MERYRNKAHIRDNKHLSQQNLRMKVTHKYHTNLLNKSVMNKAKWPPRTFKVAGILNYILPRICLKSLISQFADAVENRGTGL